MRSFTIAVLPALALGACDSKEAGSSDKRPPGPAPSAEPKPAPTAAGESITLHYVVPAVGAKWTEEKTRTLGLTSMANGRQLPFNSRQVARTSLEVLAVSATAVTKAKVTYQRVDRTEEVDGKPQKTSSPLAGKTYVLEAGSPIAVSTDAGPAPDAEAAEVRELEAGFGTPPRIPALLENKRFTKERAVDLPTAEIARAMGDDPEMTVHKMAVTYKGMEGDLATFNLMLDVTRGRDGDRMTMQLVGKVLLDPKSSALASQQLDGPMKVTGKAPAEGNIQITQKRER